MRQGLHDYLSPNSNKERAWARYKRRNMLYADRLESMWDQFDPHTLEKLVDRVRSCGESLTFVKSDDDKRLVLAEARFCKDRFCALCQWRRMLKVTYQMTKTIEQSIIENPSSRFLFLTLTVKNVNGDELRDTITAINKAFIKMTKWVRVKSTLIGFVRSTEVTVNREDMTYHPHLHVLLQVKSSYFKKGSYINQKEWQALWKKALQLDYDPMVNVKIIRPKTKDKSSVSSAVSEVGKYTVKPTTYLSMNDAVDREIISTLRTQLVHLRMVSYGLRLKEINKLLFKDKDIDDDLVHTDDSCADIHMGAERIVAEWNASFNNYVVIEKGRVL